MKNKFKVGDRVVLATDLEIGKDYNGITLIENLVNEFHDKEAIVEEVSISTPRRDSNNEHWCKLVGNAFYYGVDMLEFVPNSLRDIIDKKISCVVNVSSTTQAKILYDIFYGKLSTNVFLDFVQIFNRKVGVSRYENGIAFSFYKGKPQGFCYKEWYKQLEKKYGKIYDFEDLYIFEDLYTEDVEKVKMDKQERIKELKKQIEEINAEINELERDDTLEQYESDITWRYDGYILNECGCVNEDNDSIFNATDYNPYRHYMTEEYANKAAKIKKFNDMLMAFKWCYDRDYEPDWDYEPGWTTDYAKYHVIYNSDANSKRYHVDGSYTYRNNEIYFSSEDIAQKCADWLNDIDPNGELIV